MNERSSTLVRRLKKIAFWLICLCCFALALATLWLFYYSRDLPDTRHLIAFAPVEEAHLVDSCLAGPVTAVPLNRISPSFRDAIAVVESSPDGETALASLIKDGFRDLESRPRRGPSLQLARTLFCTPSRTLERALKETRVAIQLDNRFSREQLFTIYLNRLYFGDCGSGVEDGARCLFHKHAADLTTAESALLAGLVQSPNRFSPSRHPDRALERRNAIIEEMVVAGRLSSIQAQAAKSAPLLD